MEPKTPADPAADPNAPTPTPAAAPAPDLQKQFEALQKQHEQAMAALAAIQASQPQNQPPAPAPEPEAQLTPEFQQMAATFFKRELAPFLQDMRQQLQAAQGWQSGQQLRQLSQEIELPSEVETEIGNLMHQYAQAGRPISHQTATRHILGLREEQRLRQEAITRRSKQQFNTSMMPAFSGSGGLPNLQPLNGQRPKDNDIQGWAKFAEDHDMPLS